MSPNVHEKERAEQFYLFLEFCAPSTAHVYLGTNPRFTVNLYQVETQVSKIQRRERDRDRETERDRDKDTDTETERERQRRRQRNRGRDRRRERREDRQWARKGEKDRLIDREAMTVVTDRDG